MSTTTPEQLALPTFEGYDVRRFEVALAGGDQLYLNDEHHRSIVDHLTLGRPVRITVELLHDDGEPLDGVAQLVLLGLVDKRPHALTTKGVTGKATITAGTALGTDPDDA